VTEEQEKVRARIVISGRVQGVFFRQETKDRARTLSVTGWITNRSDGRVEAVFQGSRESVDSMIEWCRQGPSLADVESVEVNWESPTDEKGFSVR
jgi:acylphosphatase